MTVNIERRNGNSLVSPNSRQEVSDAGSEYNLKIQPKSYVNGWMCSEKYKSKTMLLDVTSISSDLFCASSLVLECVAVCKDAPKKHFSVSLAIRHDFIKNPEGGEYTNMIK